MIGASGAIVGDPRRVPRPVPGRADPVARVPRLLLPADRGPGDHRPRLLVRCSSSSTASARSGMEAGAGVAFFAHIGGFVAGAVVASAPDRRAGGSPARREPRGIIRPWPDGLDRDGRRERPRPHAVQPPRRDPQGARAASATCPIWIGPWEASAIAMRLQGLTPGAPADPRPVRDDARAARRARRAGRHLDARRRDVPRPAVPRARRADRRGRRAAVRRARARGPRRRAGSSRPRTCSTRPALGADGGLGEDGRGDRGRPRDRPASRSSTRGSTCSATSSTRSTSTRASRRGAPPEQLARPRGSVAEDRRPPAQRPRAVRPQPQAEQPEVLDRAEDDRRLRAGRRARPSAGSAGRRPRRRDRPAACSLISSSAEKNAPPGLDAHALERLAPEQLAGAVDVADLEAEEDPVGEPVSARVDRADRADRRA